VYIKRFRQFSAGRSITYLALAHNVQERRPSDAKKQTRPHLILSLGPEESNPPEALEDLIAMASAVYERRIQAGMSPLEAIDAVRKAIKPRLSQVQHADDAILESRTVGMRLLLSMVWRELGLDNALKDVAKRHRIRAFDFERLVFGLVLNRIVDPMSKRAANDWLQRDAYMPEAEGWDVQHFYRALDILHEHAEEIETRIGDALLSVSGEDDRQVFLVDTTSLFFEALQNDAEIAALAKAWDDAEREPGGRSPLRPRPRVVNEPALRMQGHNKDGHPGDPQVVLASVCLRNGLVVRHRVYPGNTNDKTIAQDLVKTIQPLAQAPARVWVSDGGMTSKALFDALTIGGWHWLVADSPRKSTVAKAHVLPLVGRYTRHPNKSQYSFRHVVLPTEDSARPEAMVVVRNALERERQLTRQAKHLEEVRGALSKRSRVKGGHGKAVCAVIDHPSLKRYVTESERRPGHYVLDHEAIRREEQLAGTRLLRTTLTEMPGWELFEGYQLLQVVEGNHREYKGPLALRPVYHRSAERLKAHVMLAVIAGNCLRRLETLTGCLIADLRKRFDRLQAHRVRSGGHEYWVANAIPKEDQKVLKQLGIPILPDQWTHWREPAFSRNPAPIQALALSGAK